MKVMFIKIKFQKLRLCFNIFGLKFCIVMFIPVGFKFDFVEKKVGWKIPGITLLKARIFQQHILSVKY